MRVLIHVGRLVGRRATLIAMIATVAVALAAPVQVAAADLDEYQPPVPNEYGWFNVDPLNLRLIARVENGYSGKGYYEEHVKGVECTGDGVSGGIPSDGSIRSGDTIVPVSIQGPTGWDGVRFECTATFLRTYPTSCTIVFGVEVCIPPRQEPDEVTRTYADTVRIDETGPTTVTGTPTVQPNAAGWYRTAGFVSFSGTDPESGVRICSATQAFGGVSAIGTQTVPASCINYAGVTRTGSFTYRFDNVAPTLAPSVIPSVITVNGAATASANATDQHSGIKSQGCDPLDTTSPGTHTVSCTATDRADNTAPGTASYTVAYGFSGFAQPVDSAAQNVAKAGRSIPLKWRVTDAAGAPVLDLAAVTVTATTLSCAAGATEDPIEEYATNSSGLQDLGDGYYQFNWSTPKSYANTCKTLKLDLGDGIAHTATFEFTK